MISLIYGSIAGALTSLYDDLSFIVFVYAASFLFLISYTLESLPKVRNHPYYMKIHAFYIFTKLHERLIKRGWDWVQESHCDELLIQIGEAAFAIPDVKELKNRDDYEEKSVGYLYQIGQETYTDYLPVYSRYKKQSPLTLGSALLLLSIAGYLLFCFYHALNHPEPEGMMLFLNYTSILLFAAHIAIHLIAKSHLHKKGYTWINVSDVADLFVGTGLRTFKIPSVAEAEKNTEFQNYNVLSLILLARTVK